jgi:hypothetical protein
VLVTAFAHACLNSFANALTLPLAGVEPLWGGVTGIVGVLVFGGVGLWLTANRPRTW